ncbi:acyl-CoA thioesterase [Fulvivirga sp. 29W222]|uniref:Acyl-CoA thioesterase n=1 Tax=Fulvivirga marina TaxID=2494733 RepID=A0A937KCP7_9BACT|nr:acyl-CoA thioesterase [Fulvivirga marina]MBL6445443.1 acyl-CoA thioesterase [Fulvivirga marina]
MITFEPEIFKHEIIVQENHIDDLKHVNNVTYLDWVQHLAHQHWIARATPELLKYKWVVLNHFIEYKRPAFLGEKILATTFIGKTEGVRCERFAEFYKNGQLLAKARSEWCMIEGETLKPVRVPEDMYKLFSS